MSFPDGYFARISPSGIYAAAGSSTLRVYDLSPGGVLSNPRNLGAGHYASWLSNTRLAYYDRTSAIRVSDAPFITSSVLVPSVVLNNLSGGGGIVAGYNAGLQNVRAWDTTGALVATYASRSWPSVDNNGRISMGNPQSNALYLSTSGQIASGYAFIDAQVSTAGLVWSRLLSQRRTYGWAGATVQDLSIHADHEFHPYLVDTPSGPWVLVYTNTALYLHPWGNSTKLTVALGGTIDYPHARYDAGAGGFQVVWVQSGLLESAGVTVDITDPAYAIGAGTVVGGGGSGGGGGSSGASSPRPRVVSRPADLEERKAPRTYPRVPDMKKGPERDSIRMLWDRVHELTERQQDPTLATSVQSQLTALQASLAAQQAATELKLQQLSAGAGEAKLTRTLVPGGESPGSGGGGGEGGGEEPGGTANHLDVVVAARAIYAAYSGIERAGRIVNHVAWDLRNEGFGVVRKTSGVNWNNWSIDVIMVSPNAATYDILRDAEGDADPQWSRTSPTGFGDIDRWVAPVDPTSI